MRNALKCHTGKSKFDSARRSGHGLVRSSRWLLGCWLLARAVAVATLPVLLLGCSVKDPASTQPSTLMGKACIPFDETIPAFSGSGGVSMYLGATDCGGEVCFAYEFQGRVTCPYGQSDEGIATLPATDPGRCRLPDETGRMTQAPVTVEVPPQLVERRAEVSVYCSCACAGTDSSKEYCTCPSNMRCEQIVVGGSRITDTGFCVRLDSPDRTSTISTVTCSRSSSDPITDCGNNRQNP